MKFKFYLLFLLFFHFLSSSAQDCSTLSVSYSAFESRCVATGSITVNVTGGSGTYNYKAVGPVTTPITSSNNITGLPTGYYNIFVKDLTTNCVKEVDSVFVPGSYSDPRFQLIKTDASCAGNDGTISLFNQQNGRSPFSYTIIAPSPSNIGTSNSSGNFSGLMPGEYFIQLRDSCGGIQVRRITIENYNWWFDNISVTRIGCDSAAVMIRLKDNKGNVDTSGIAFNGFNYGVVLGTGDTSWHPTNSFQVLLGHKRSLTIVVKDNCGNIHSSLWVMPDALKPSAGTVSLTSLSCTDFTATLTGLQNIPNPIYCLYNSVTLLNVGCNTTGVFTNVYYGSYCISVYDDCYDTTIVRCFVLNKGVPSIDPDVNISNKTCSVFTATITGQNNLYSADFCLYDSSNNVISCNGAGVFTDIPYGTYCIKTHDACTDTTITRCFTVTRPVPVLTGYVITGSTCTTFNVSTSGNNLINPYYCLYDSLGNVIACDSTGVFTGINHGHYCIKAVSCGDTTNTICFTTSKPVPSIGGAVEISQQNCTTFTATISGQTNLTNPLYCLYDRNDSLVVCDSTGIFNNIPYGSYCIKVHDGCIDTLITRCFTASPPVPNVNSTIQLLSSACSTISIQINGTNLSNAGYCLRDSANNVLQCDSTGLFSNIPYGSYCVVVHNGCPDTTMTVCQTFRPVKGITLATSKSCTIGTTNIDVQFVNGNSPYTIKVYHPNGSVVYNTTTSSNPYRIQLPSLPATAQYKIIGADNCGNKDTAFITPDANIVTKSISVNAKCPSALWLNGAGDLIATCTTNIYSVSPQIIKKNGASFVLGYSSNTGNTYSFADLEPAQYVVQYTQSSCNGTIYDTVIVPSYSYPAQGQSAIYQCDNNGFSLGANVHGGVVPYTYQIIGSLPDTPVIVGSPQGSAVFNINNGQIYSLIRLRTIDACGNATLSDVSVLPLQNITINASATCFYQDITLSVDTIPNATYLWYRKTSLVDSVLLDSGLTYHLPFFVPEETGDYICKVIVNGGCLTRLSTFRLDGRCNVYLLPVSFQLQGRTVANGNQLYWKNTTERNVLKYIVERKTATDANYVAIGILQQSGSNYLFNDNSPKPGTNLYRLKIIYADKFEYSNVISLRSSKNKIVVYPNPAKDVLHISLSADKATNYKVEIISTNGTLIYTTEVKNVVATTINYSKNKSLPPGIYLLRITNTDAGTIDVSKVLFE